MRAHVMRVGATRAPARGLVPRGHLLRAHDLQWCASAHGGMHDARRVRACLCMRTLSACDALRSCGASPACVDSTARNRQGGGRPAAVAFDHLGLLRDGPLVLRSTDRTVRLAASADACGAGPCRWGDDLLRKSGTTHMRVAAAFRRWHGCGRSLAASVRMYRQAGVSGDRRCRGGGQRVA